jgi:asparagine synthase (glutamine-hydrolysing)
LFKGVKKLPPGHWLRADKSGKIEIGVYWSLPAPSEERPISPEQAVDSLDNALADAVREALVADVPVGAYLSGGVDSSLIVAIAAKERSGQPLETFSAGFGDERYDELPFAQRVSKLLGTCHHEVHVRPDDFIGDWSKLTWHRDAPISEPSDMAVYRLAALAKTRVKVVLSGEGSDELFGGYPKYRYAGMSRHAGLIPNALRGPSLRFIGSRLRPGGEKLRIMLRALEGSSEWERTRGWFAPFSENERRHLLGESYSNGHAAPHLQGDSVRRMLGVDCGAWLADNLLERGDRMSMAASLELRPPFLDQRLVEMAFRMPSSVKVREKVPKWIVKEVARRHLPQEISDRRKVGFKVPLDSWFQGGLSEMANDLLCSPNSFVGGIFNAKLIGELLESHRSGRHNEEIRLWTLLSLEVWHRTFFGEAPSI